MNESQPRLGEFAHLLPRGWSDIVTLWFQEDTPSMDYGGFVVGETEETATLFGKSKVYSTVQQLISQGVLAGVPFFDEVFSQLGCS